MKGWKSQEEKQVGWKGLFWGKERVISDSDYLLAECEKLPEYGLWSGQVISECK